MLLELIDFDRVTSAQGSPIRIYDAASPYRARHREVRRFFGRLFEWTEQQGMQVFLEADMLSLAGPLPDHPVVSHQIPARPASMRGILPCGPPRYAVDRPLNFAPATETMLFALQTYAGARLELSGVFNVAAVLFVAGCLARFQLRAGSRRV